MSNGFDAYYQWLGIAPKDQPPNHYRLLGVDVFEGNPDVIESAADRQMIHVRTFQSGPHGDVSQKLLNEITTAKLCLLNAAKKAEYDGKLRADKEAAEAAARPQARAVRGERPVAKAQPLEPADTDLGPPMPRPPTIGSFDAAAPDLLPRSVGLSLPSTSTGTKLARRRMTTAQQAVIAGGVLGVLVVVLVIVLLNRGGSSSTAQTTKGKSASQGGASSSTDPVKTPPGEESKTPLVDPGAKGPPEVNTDNADVDPLKGPPSGAPVLRLTGRDYVELTDTSDVMPAKEFVWLDDAPPAGARIDGEWEWVGKPRPVFSGEKSLRLSGAGNQQRYFEAAETRLRVGEGDRYFAYVYLDPKDPPQTIMLQWKNGDGIGPIGARTSWRWARRIHPGDGPWARFRRPVNGRAWKSKQSLATCVPKQELGNDVND